MSEKLSKLKELKELLDSGAINQADFEQLKKEAFSEEGVNETSNEPDKIKKLKELKELFDDGRINQKEYDNIKSEILSAKQSRNSPITKSQDATTNRNKEVVTKERELKSSNPNKGRRIRKRLLIVFSLITLAMVLAIVAGVIWEDQFAYGRWEKRFGQDEKTENYDEYDFTEDYSDEEGYEEDYSNEQTNNNEQTNARNANCVITDVESSYLGISVKSEGSGKCFIGSSNSELIGYGIDFVVTHYNHMYSVYDCNCKSISHKEDGNIKITAVSNNVIYVKYNNMTYKYDKYWKSN